MLEELMPSLHELIAYDYDKIKNKETECIINEHLANFSSVEKPEFIQVSGIPGAGKSSYCKAHMLPNYLYISFDKIMLSLKSYQDMLIKKDVKMAYYSYEMPARVIGYELLQRALKLQLNIMLEHSGTNKAHLELLKNIKSIGYKTTINFIVCDKDCAIQRAEKREEQEGRFIPKAVINERLKNLDYYFKEYSKLTSNIKIFDGTNNFKMLKKI